MQSDPYSRAILTFIALCLLVLVAQGFGLGEREELEGEAAEGRGQWSLQMLRTGIGGPPTLLRMNTATGEISQTKFGGDEGWTPVGVPKQAAATPADAAAPAPAPTQAPEAPPAQP